jgi:hypothetical protein
MCFDIAIGRSFFEIMKMNLQDIFTFENLFAAHELCRSGKQHKRGTIMFELECGTMIKKLMTDLAAGKYRIGKYREFKIYDPKERIIKALPYKDRVMQMCFCKNSIEPRLEKRLIYDNAASRRGRGTDFSVKRLHKFMKRLFINSGCNKLYFLKCDISKYFQNIDHDILLLQLSKCGFSSDELLFMTMVLKSHDAACGVPLGNQTSQWFALVYLNELDRFVKEKLRVRCYVRYMDDFVLLSADKAFLQMCRTEIEKLCAEKLKLKLNAKTQIGRLDNGVDFLGFNHKLTSTGGVVKAMRASNKIRQKRYLKTISKYYLNDIVDDEYLNLRRASFRGHLKGTAEVKFIMNKINTLQRQKRVMKNNLVAKTDKIG